MVCHRGYIIPYDAISINVKTHNFRLINFFKGSFKTHLSQRKGLYPQRMQRGAKWKDWRILSKRDNERTQLCAMVQELDGLHTYRSKISNPMQLLLNGPSFCSKCPPRRKENFFTNGKWPAHSYCYPSSSAIDETPFDDPILRHKENTFLIF